MLGPPLLLRGEDDDGDLEFDAAVDIDDVFFRSPVPGVFRRFDFAMLSDVERYACDGSERGS